MRCHCISSSALHRRVRLALGLAACATLASALPSHAFDVEPESTDNVVHLQIDDRGGHGGEFAVSVTSSDDWLVPGTATVSYDRVVEILIPFGVASADFGSHGRLIVDVVGTNSAGVEFARASHVVPVTVTGDVDDTQHAVGIDECCSEIIPVGEAGTVPTAHKLVGNTPNPFRSLTNIVFGLSDAGGIAQVSVFDIQGRLVRSITTPRLSGGFHRVTWDGRNEAGRLAAPGTYFYRVDVGTWSETRKLHLLP